MMINRLIKNEKDYSAALARIEDLMDAKAGTPEGDELELLATIVELYEEKKYPIDMPDPIEAIRFRMEQLGLKPQDLIPFMGNRSKISEVLNRKKPLTLSMMRGLSKGLGIPADILLNEQRAGFPDNHSDLKWHRFPINEMIKRNWIPGDDYFPEKNEELIRGFIERAGGFGCLDAAFLRQGCSPRMNAKADRYAVSSWCLRVLELANKRPLKQSYRKGALNSAVFKEIIHLSYLSDGPVLAGEYLEKQGIHLVVLPHLPKTYLDGSAMLLPNGSPVVGLTLRYDRIDNFWFSLLHELIHISKHLSRDRQMIVDDFDMRKHEKDSLDHAEKEADELASDVMIPEKYWKRIELMETIASENITELAEQLKIHPAIIAGRIRFEKNNYRLFTRFVGQGTVRKLFSTCQS